MAKFMGTLGIDVANSLTGTLTGFTAGSADDLALLTDNIGDTFFGLDGDDSVVAGAGDDTIYGGLGADNLNGGAGNDILRGADGNDTLLGGFGDDDIGGGTGNDELSGGAGIDRLFGNLGNDILEGGDGSDRLSGVDGDDVLYADTSGTASESSGNFLLGGDGDDQLFGANGADILSGGEGNDIVSGGNGADRIQGRHGQDVLTGGGGGDRFIYVGFSDESIPGSERDVVTDFEQSLDIIDVSRIDPLAGPGDSSFTFIGTGPFSGAGGEIRFFQSAAGNFTVIAFDFDGDKKVDMQIELTGLKTLTEDDFKL